MTDRWALKTSLFLLWHAEDPAEWFPWGPEAFETARAQGKPMFSSVGYSACHWCHVMEHESLEDEATAALMNRHFVSVKVDCEERPDIEAIYMKAVQAMTEYGRWPMNVFLTPEGEPFYSGAYSPDTPRHRLPSFSQVLERIAEVWETQRDEPIGAGNRLSAALVQSGGSSSGSAPTAIDASILDAAIS